MNKAAGDQIRFKGTGPGREQARALVIVLVALIVAACAIGVMLRFRKSNEPEAPEPALLSQPREAAQLSSVTRDVLNGLNSRVEIRFYSFPGQSRGSDSLRDYAGDVNALLSAFQREAHGNLKITQIDSRLDSSLTANALSDGIEPFLSNRREDCFFGLAVIHDDRKLSIPRLLPEWGQALEFDLTRAIMRVTESKTTEGEFVDATRINVAATEEVRRSIPNLESVSVEEGTRILRESTLEDARADLTATRDEVDAAQQKVLEAKSAAERTAALNELQELQAAQTKKLQETARQFKAQIEALERLKGVTSESRPTEKIDSKPGSTR